ncbi:uncharacterized protein LOC110092240 [Dendrobium catenatum]|uniref:uncharacterized protein LOC110092240 n=1 Tax=Dendrobium catenatum TaxID=906689 RepID=UPI0010A02E04|nr:uncharacterized protein LOC110092240 [Dendrobium catenatum]
MSLVQPLDSVTEEAKPEILVKGAVLEGKERELATMGAGPLACADNCDYGFDGGSFRAEKEKDQEVDVIGCEEEIYTAAVKAENPDADATEHSSSFGDTFSGSDEGLKINSSDVEVESPLFIENGHQRAVGGPVRLFKKSKVTADWKKFISPLMWRCQWLELRMKELQSQALRYDKELVAYKHEKQLQLKMIDLDDSVSRSVPLACKRHKKPAMKRRKRIRNEDSVNISSYMSNHNIFSYYEKRRGDTEGHSVDDDFSDQVNDITRGSHDQLWALDFRDGDRSLEQVLLNIEALQSRVLKAKAHLNQIIIMNVRDVTLCCSFMGDQPVSSAQSPSCSLGNIGHQMPAGVPNTPPHHGSEYDEMDDMVLPGSAVSSFGDAPDLDIMESTMGFLSGADGPLNPNQLEEFCKDNADDVLINNQAADEELQNFEVSHVREKLLREIATSKEPDSDDGSTAPSPASIAVESADQSLDGEAVDASQPLNYTGKRRGRKPKRRRRGGSAAGWKSERLQKRRKLSG